MTNAEHFFSNGYVYIKNAIDKNIADIVSAYSLFDEQQHYKLETGETPQIHNSHSSYGDPLMESMLQYMIPFMEENTGLQLYPTYSYYRVYRPGAELLVHTDRPSCEVSTTITLKFDYKEQADTYSWPIFMNGHKCDMNAGDLVIYKGCELAHWREKFTAPAGSYHIQVFLHYVDVNGPFADYKWDGRPSLGFLKTSGTANIVNFNPTSKSYITFTD
jgi:hypothetical protein